MQRILKTKKAKLIAAGIVISSIVIWQIVKHHHRTAAFAQDAVVVDVKKVAQGNISIEARAVGTLVAARSVQLAPEVAGQVAKILVHDGALVKTGTPLIQLDDVVNKAKAEAAKATLTYSEANYGRMQQLANKGVISKQAIEQASADLKEKKALEQESRVLAEKMQITAPFDGVIGKVKVNLGEHVTIGQTVVALTDTQNLRVEFTISEKYLAKLKIGQQVSLTTSAYPGQTFFGKVSYIAPTINTEDRTISTYADVPNQDGRLTAGLFVNVTQLLGEENNIILIPSVSLVATIDGQQVYKVIDGKATAVPVMVGLRTQDQVQITQGITLGDTVVIAGQHKIKDGTAVKVKA